jgi:hypothetical protein
MKSEKEATMKNIQENQPDGEPKFVSVQITAELSIDLDSMYFDAENHNFRPGDLQEDLIGEAIAVKSGVFENAVWGNITSVTVAKAVE